MPKNYMNVEDAKKFLKLSKSTLYEYVHEKKIPYVKVGDRVLFDEADLVTWMESKKKEATYVSTK